MVVGYVYEIVGGGNRYVGSTYMSIYERFRAHKSAHRRHQNGNGIHQRVYDILACADVTINTLERVITADAPDPVRLRDRERFYIEALQCVNTNLPNNTHPCMHNKPRHLCVYCGGSSMCQHSKVKYQCVVCQGANICQHSKQRQQCKVCNPRECPICHKILGSSHGLKYHISRHAQPKKEMLPRGLPQPTNTDAEQSGHGGNSLALAENIVDTVDDITQLIDGLIVEG